MEIKKSLGVFLAYLMQVLILILNILAFISKDYGVFILGLISFFITLIPLFLKRKWKITLPWTLNFLLVLMIFLHISGIVIGWYKSFYPFYDKFGHFIGSFTIALLGFTSVLIIDWYTKVELTDKSIIVFVIIFTLAVGAFWEILEFSSDIFLGTTNQKSLTDTMLDLIFDLVGGIIASIIAMFKLKHGRKNLLEKMFEKLIKKIK
jgi:hypothetical protein